MRDAEEECVLRFTIVRGKAKHLLPKPLDISPEFRHVVKTSLQKEIKVDRTKWATEALGDTAQWDRAMKELQSTGTCTLRLAQHQWQFRAWRAADAEYMGTLEDVLGQDVPGENVPGEVPRVAKAPRGLDEVPPMPDTRELRRSFRHPFESAPVL